MDQQKKGFDPRKVLKPGFEAIKEKVKEKMELFGSDQQKHKRQNIPPKSGGDFPALFYHSTREERNCGISKQNHHLKDGRTALLRAVCKEMLYR